jgi:exocyst complex component 1
LLIPRQIFSAKIEEQLPPEQLSIESLDIRDMVNNGYSIINRAMFDAMQAIAKQSPTAGSQSLDPEDKEQLNYHILIIQNMDHYIEEVDVRNNSVLQDFKQKAEEEFKEHMALYVGAVIRRYLEKTLVKALAVCILGL